MSQQVLDSIQFDNSGDGGSFTQTYQAEIVTAPDVADNEMTVSVAEGFDYRRGYNKEFTVRILEPDTFPGTGSNDSIIDDLMESRNDVTVTFNWKSVADTTVLSGGKVTATPVMDEVPDNTTVWYDTDTSATDNPDTDSDSSWTELSEVVGDTSHESENVTVANGRDLPYWVYSRFMHPIPLFYDGTAFSNIKTEEDNRNEIRVAIENQAGNFRIYGGGGTGVQVNITSMPAPEPDQVARMMMTVYQSGSFTDIITYPSGAEDFFYGTELTFETWGHDEADVFTENRTF